MVKYVTQYKKIAASKTKQVMLGDKYSSSQKKNLISEATSQKWKRKAQYIILN